MRWSTYAGVALFAALAAATVLALGELEPPATVVPTVRIVLDPGHGGRPERCSDHGGAHWDPYTKRFLNFYRFGASRRWKGRTWTEHELMLMLARKIRKRLDLTRQPSTRPAFAALVRRVTGSDEPVPAVDVETLLTRDNSHLDHPERGKPNVNRFFRLFDSPESFPYVDGAALYPGRLSKTAVLQPRMVVCLHVNGSATSSMRGFHALYVPGWEHFEQVRRTILAREGFNALTKTPVYRTWFKHDAGRSRLQWMFNDTWTYFTGYGCNPDGGTVQTSTDVGVRYDDLQWAYRSPVRAAERTTSLTGPFDGPFWQRERSTFEQRRRAGGLEGYGGDNLYAGHELIRFMSLALWRDLQQGSSDEREGATVRGYLGRIHRPTAADWAVPLFSNAVTPFLELGYLSNDGDFRLLREKLDVVADGLAVGIHSLLVGTRSRAPTKDFDRMPRGAPIAWSEYGPPSGPDYFRQVTTAP